LLCAKLNYIIKKRDAYTPIIPSLPRNPGEPPQGGKVLILVRLRLDFSAAFADAHFGRNDGGVDLSILNLPLPTG